MLSVDTTYASKLLHFKTWPAIILKVYLDFRTCKAPVRLLCTKHMLMSKILNSISTERTISARSAKVSMKTLEKLNCQSGEALVEVFLCVRYPYEHPHYKYLKKLLLLHKSNINVILHYREPYFS